MLAGRGTGWWGGMGWGGVLTSALRPGTLSFGMSQLLHLLHHLHIDLHKVAPCKAPPVAGQCATTLRPAPPSQRNLVHGVLCISSFSCCRDKMSSQKPLKGERVCYSSSFKGVSYHAMEGMVSAREGGGHMASTVRREMNAGAQSTFSSFLGLGLPISTNRI